MNTWRKILGHEISQTDFGVGSYVYVTASPKMLRDIGIDIPRISGAVGRIDEVVGFDSPISWPRIEYSGPVYVVSFRFDDIIGGPPSLSFPMGDYGAMYLRRTSPKERKENKSYSKE